MDLETLDLVACIVENVQFQLTAFQRRSAEKRSDENGLYFRW